MNIKILIYICIFTLLLGFTGCIPQHEEVLSLPTLAVLPTLTPSSTFTLTPEITLTPTLTNTPVPTNTQQINTATPTLTATIIPTSTPSPTITDTPVPTTLPPPTATRETEIYGPKAEELYQAILKNDFVVFVETVGINPSRDNSQEFLLYITMRVKTGQNTQSNAMVINTLAENLLGRQSIIDFLLILHDCKDPISYGWNEFYPELSAVPLTYVDESELC